MEKKQNRSVQATSKGGGTETKKIQDGTNGKPWPRGGRRREPSGSSFSSKNDGNRKPAPQRNKFMDKRPKPRGTYYSGAVGGKENSGLADDTEAELGSVFVPGSKKQSLNHLLNFHYAPRGDNWNSNDTAHRNSSATHRWLTTQKHKYNKEHFLQANCQFVVNSEGDYKQYLNNPDALVDWDLVEQINIQVSEFPSCPICLYPPVAAKMTRCGHIYCWSCILHYLALTDTTWRKCPICYEAVHKNDLKSVVSIPHNAFNIGETIKFRLMKRPQGSLIAVPVEECNIMRNKLLNMSETAVDTVYSKLLLANPTEAMSIIERERNELVAQRNEDNNCRENCFIDQAIKILDERECKTLQKLVCNSPRTPDISDKFSENILDSNKIIDHGNPIDLLFIDNHKIHLESSGDAENSENLQSIKNYYFYQASDGQHIYLHAMNVRMLEHCYGSLENSPVVITGRILEKEGGSMTEDIRKRLRCLQHLPITCQFEVAEIYMAPPIITKETVEHFYDQIEIRRRRRQKRARDEKRREKRIADEENRRMGRFPEAKVDLESFRHFPQCGNDLASSSSTTEFPGSPTSELSISPPSTSVDGASSTGPSFAKMLSTTKIKSPKWPELSNINTPEQPVRLINVTGAKLKISGLQKARRTSESEPEPEDYVPAPAYNQSFGDAIASALEKATISDNSHSQDAYSNGKKKKKNKQKILFATSMVYSGK